MTGDLDQLQASYDQANAAYEQARAELDAAQAWYDQLHLAGRGSAQNPKPAGQQESGKQVSEADLPKTGDATAAGEVFVVGGMVLLAAGVFLGRRRGQQE